ncbi:MAG TPA: gluconate 2-dehydrogenase subunit 3 family protein [Gemmatimonadaceae bacterium]
MSHPLRFFSSREAETVRILVDMIVPRDERSGGAIDADVPEYLDLRMVESPSQARERMRLGLAWIEAESRNRFGLAFASCPEAMRHDLIASIAWPVAVEDPRRTVVAFFAWFRHMTAVGFWTSEIGHADLGFHGGEHGDPRALPVIAT